MVSSCLESLLWQEQEIMLNPYELVTPNPKLTKSTHLYAALGHWYHGHTQTSAQEHSYRHTGHHTFPGIAIS